jgi:hypothetical protein
MRGYYYIQTGLTALGFITAWFLVEPKLHVARKEVSWQSILQVVHETLWKKPLLSRYIILSSIIGFASLSMAWFAQIYLFNAGVQKSNFGVVWTALNLMVAMGSFSSFTVDRLFGPRRVLILLILFLSGGFILSAQIISFWGIAFLLIFYFVRGTAHPIMKDRINHLTESNVRATVLSVRSLIIRILFALIGPVFGWFTDKIDLRFALMLCGFIILFPGIFLVVTILRNKE